jgi:anaerobic ribonucleoside-triphosphate reductase activating protein
MNLAHIEEKSYIYGPGSRFVIWTQGCSLHCEGCWNVEMWSFEKNLRISNKALFARILCIQKTENIEGITILGGEPLDQYDEALSLVKMCKSATLSTVLFSGYEYDEIIQSKSEILRLIDILICGRYEKEKRTVFHQWIGSTNQQILFLSDVYKDYQLRNANYVEIDIEADGSQTVLGFPDGDTFSEVM